eukprot:690407-Alexandrium_andersonii.AAC.1
MCIRDRHSARSSERPPRTTHRLACGASLPGTVGIAGLCGSRSKWGSELPTFCHLLETRKGSKECSANNPESGDTAHTHSTPGRRA